MAVTPIRDRTDPRRDDASEQREFGAAGDLGLAVDVAQNAADAYPNIPSDNAVVSRA